ncbi:MAG: (p)ppGpp synthetase [Lachnospiraceae bacterium]|nr:(p)ppGpp synthetase [Lachnospiraceae bacterium]
MDAVLNVETEQSMIPDADYDMLVIPYKDATANLLVRLNTLNQDYRLKYKNYPIHHIQDRIKRKKSIEQKLLKKKRPVSADEARETLTDIAGVRIICYFEEDIYSVIEMIKRQSDILMLREKDYVKNPKPSGYMSYHLILGMPVYHTDGMEYYPVEVQLRTLSMDLWASMEHRICYKESDKTEPTRAQFRDMAQKLRDMEYMMREMADE